jgi:hypothetical protein
MSYLYQKRNYMKKILVFSVLVIILHTNIKAQWIQTNGPSSGYLTDLTSDGTNIYIAASSQNNSSRGPGVFHSNNNGTNWTQKNNGLTKLDKIGGVQMLLQINLGNQQKVVDQLKKEK